MKELEKTRKLSIVAVLSILVLVIALVSYKRPKHVFTKTTQEALEYVSSETMFLNYEQLTENDLIIDIRNKFDFDGGHLPNAQNLFAPELFNTKNEAVFETLFNTDKRIALIGNNTNECISLFTTLYRMGCENIVIVNATQNIVNNELIVKEENLEKEQQNIDDFIKASIKKASLSKIKPKPTPPKPKKIIPKKKKKKMPMEGGC